jgi:hypothetical protein
MRPALFITNIQVLNLILSISKRTLARISDLCLIILPFFILSLASCSGKKVTSLEPSGLEQLKVITVNKGDLKAVFVDNTDMPPNHRAGYNGIAELYHAEQDSTVFVPSYAGFNLEHVFNGDSLVQFFEPRVNPMKLYKKSGNEVLLYQNTTPVSGAESLTEFRLVEPGYIDITFRCIFHDAKYFTHDYAGFFWASYINKPPEKSIYFRGVDDDQSDVRWISAFSDKHGTKSTHRAINDKFDFYFAPDFRASLANNYSDYRYALPFYFGRFHNMALGFFFHSTEVIRLTQSPTGGGSTNPAWDFQWLIPNPVKGKVYEFKARIVYKPFTGNGDMLEEYEKWEESILDQ